MPFVLRRPLLLHLISLLCVVCLSLVLFDLPAEAGTVDPFVLRYLDAREPVSLQVDDQGQTRLFSASQLSEGKRLFEENCKNCHVGGSTLPDPTVPLSLLALSNATPARDNIRSLVAYLRHPMTYDGSEESDFCRQIPESWLPQATVESLAAFVLRSAQKAPGWGSTSF